MKPIEIILLAPGEEREGRLRRGVLKGLVDLISAQLSPGSHAGSPVEVLEDNSALALEARPQAWIIASPAAHPQVIEAARRCPRQMILLPDLAAPLRREQEDFWKEQAHQLAAVVAVSQGEREEAARRWGLQQDAVIRIGLGLAGAPFHEGEPNQHPLKADRGEASASQPGTPVAKTTTGQEQAADSTVPFHVDLLQAWNEGQAVVVDASQRLRRDLCLEADGGLAVPSRRMNEARLHLREQPPLARQLGLQGRLYVTACHDAPASAHTLLRLLRAIPARRGLAGRRVALYTPSFLPYDAVSNYVAETCRLLKAWGAEFSLHVQDDLRRRDFAAHLRPVADPDPQAQIEIYHYPGYYPAVERLRQPSQALRIFDYHGVTPSSLWPDDSLAQSEREIALAREADAVFTHSLFSQDFLQQEHGVPSEKMVRFPYSVDLSAFSPRPADRELLAGYGLESMRPLLYVGRMAPNKRIDVLVEGLARLPQDCALLLAGDATHPIYAREKEKARQLARRLGVDSRVVFTGSVSDPELRRLFHSAHLFVSASLHEGFGIPFIEAMACGLPSLGSRAASIPEVIGQAGRTFQPADPGDFARQAVTLLEDDAAYQKAIEAGLRQVQLYDRHSLAAHFALALEQATGLSDR